MRITALVLLSVLLPRQAAAVDCHVAQEAYARGDFAAALAQWRELSDERHAHSQLRIGSLYFNGEGVKQDYAEAARWYGMAADNGSADATLQLAQMYAKGEGVAQDVNGLL